MRSLFCHTQDLEQNSSKQVSIYHYLLACFLGLASHRTLKHTCSWLMGHLFCVWCGLRIQCTTAWWRRWWLDVWIVAGRPSGRHWRISSAGWILLLDACGTPTDVRTLMRRLGMQRCVLTEVCDHLHIQAVLCAPWALHRKGAGGALRTGMVHMACTDKVRQPEKVEGK